MTVNWGARLLTASLVIFSLHDWRYCSGLEWKAQSLLQPGPCPTPSGIATSFDVQQMKGLWSIVQLPRQFPTCCRRPTVDVADVTAVNLQPKTSPNDTQNGATIKVAVDWSTCSADGIDLRNPLSTFRLRSNAMAPSTLLMDLPWPFNIAGFATLNIVSTDYKHYAVGYVCHALLLEHISIPFTLGRLNVEIDATQTNRFKWSLVKQGILAAWDLMNTVSSECSNSLPLPATQTLEEAIVHVSSSTPAIPNDHVQEPETHVENSGVSTDIETTSMSTGHEGVEHVTHDPDADAEWITTDSNQVKPVDGDHPISFPDDLPGPAPTYPARPELPGSYPGLGGIWPSIFFGHHDPEEIDTVTDQYTADPKVITFAADPLEDGRMAHLEAHESI